MFVDLFQRLLIGGSVLPNYDGLIGVRDASWGRLDYEKRKSASVL